jgi:hypothetical protein
VNVLLRVVVKFPYKCDVSVVLRNISHGKDHTRSSTGSTTWSAESSVIPGRMWRWFMLTNWRNT